MCEFVEVAESVIETVDEGDGVGVPSDSVLLSLPVAVAEGVADKERLVEAVCDSELEKDSDCESDTDAVLPSLPVTVDDDVPDRERLVEAVCESELEDDSDWDADAEAVAVPESLPDRERVKLSDTVFETVPEPVPDSDTLKVTLLLEETVRDCESLDVGDSEAVRDDVLESETDLEIDDVSV